MRPKFFLGGFLLLVIGGVLIGVGVWTVGALFFLFAVILIIAGIFD